MKQNRAEQRTRQQKKTSSLFSFLHFLHYTFSLHLSRILRYKKQTIIVLLRHNFLWSTSRARHTSADHYHRSPSRRKHLDGGCVFIICDSSSNYEPAIMCVHHTGLARRPTRLIVILFAQLEPFWNCTSARRTRKQIFPPSKAYVTWAKLRGANFKQQQLPTND